MRAWHSHMTMVQVLYLGEEGQMAECKRAGCLGPPCCAGLSWLAATLRKLEKDNRSLRGCSVSREGTDEL